MVILPSLQWPGCPCSQDRLRNWAHWPGVGFDLGMGAVEVGEFDGDNHRLITAWQVKHIGVITFLNHLWL
jgi:hypothetical protein